MVALGLLFIFLGDYAGFFHGPENYFYDLSFRLRGNRPPSQRLVIAAIDETTLAKLGRWPIDRSYYAAALDAMPAAQAIGLDIIFSEPSGDDDLLAAAIKKHGRVVLPAFIDSRLRTNYPLGKFEPAAVGHIHLGQGIDGVIREVFHTLSYENTVLPSFGSVVYQTATGRNLSELRVHHNLPPENSATRIFQQLPMLINYYGTQGSFPTLPFADIVEGKVAPAFFQDKVVLIGVTATGIEEKVLTPFLEERNRMSGVEVHANIVTNLFANECIEKSGWWFNLISVSAAVFLSFFIHAAFPGRLSTLFWLGAIVLVSLLSFLLFTLLHLWVNPAIYYVAITMAAVLAYIFDLEKMGVRLSLAKADWEDTFNSIDDGITIHDQECRILRANKSARKMGPGFLDNLVGRCLKLRAAQEAELEDVPGEPGLQPAKETRSVVLEEEFAPELEKVFEIKTLPRVDENGQPAGTVQIVRDVTLKKKAEEEQRNLAAQLIQSQRMEAIGRLSGGVAHDFNNMLTAILGYSEISMHMLAADHPVKGNLEVIFQSGQKAAALTRQLLAFSRKQVLEMKIVNLNTIINNLVKMLGRLIGEDITLEIRAASELGNIMADPGQMEQILMNLVVNARDAMPNGGRLVIETAEVFLDEDYARRHENVEPGPYAMLAVTDTGEGMPPQILEKIFEPFFTTKEHGKGTGLGLATVHGIVTQHKGHIYVYSEPWFGTAFKIYFPLEHGAAPVAEKKEAVTPVLGNETILVVEDEASIRKLIYATLQPLGYALLSASSGEEAIGLCRTTERKIHLLLTDVILPGMNGRDLARGLKKNQSDIRVIFMSGYTDETISKHGVLEPGIIFIQKPLVPSALARTIRNVLDDPGAGKEV